MHGKFLTATMSSRIVGSRMVVEACAAIILRGGRVLVTQRKSDQTFPLRWELPGGHIEPNESKEACLQREIKEELGVRTTVLKPFCKRKARIGRDRVLIYYYLCRIAHGKVKQLEVQDFRWIHPSRYLTLYDLAPSDKRVLQRLSILPAEELS